MPARAFVPPKVLLTPSIQILIVHLAARSLPHVGKEMLDFWGAHNITADLKVIPVQKSNEAYDRMLKSDVKCRFPIDMKTLG